MWKQKKADSYPIIILLEPFVAGIAPEAGLLPKDPVLIIDTPKGGWHTDVSFINPICRSSSWCRFSTLCGRWPDLGSVAMFVYPQYTPAAYGRLAVLHGLSRMPKPFLWR